MVFRYNHDMSCMRAGYFALLPAEPVGMERHRLFVHAFHGLGIAQLARAECGDADAAFFVWSNRGILEWNFTNLLASAVPVFVLYLTFLLRRDQSHGVFPPASTADAKNSLRLLVESWPRSLASQSFLRIR